MASVLRAARLSWARGLPQHWQRAPTPCGAAASMLPSYLRQPVRPPAPGRATHDFPTWRFSSALTVYKPRVAMDLGRGSSYGRQISTASLGRIQPEGLGFATPPVRTLTTDRNFEKPNLPVLVQTDFFHQEDINVAEWKDVVSFLEKHPAVIEAHRHNKMIPAGGDRPWMLSGTGRGFWHSVAQLVVFNKLRGYDISRALVEDNLLVSPYGTVALKLPIADPYDGNRPFAGYKALRSLFYNMMQKVYGCAVLQLLTLDVKHFVDSLENVTDDRLPLYHAVFLSPFGRASLSIRLQSLVRFEVNPEGPWVSIDSIKKLLSNLPDVSDNGKENTDEMHIIFRCLRQHGQKRKAQDAKSESDVGEASTKESEDEADLKELDEEQKCDLKEPDEEQITSFLNSCI